MMKLTKRESLLTTMFFLLGAIAGEGILLATTSLIVPTLSPIIALIVVITALILFAMVYILHQNVRKLN